MFWYKTFSLKNKKAKRLNNKQKEQVSTQTLNGSNFQNFTPNWVYQLNLSLLIQCQ